jgi:hypothetical protein
MDVMMQTAINAAIRLTDGIWEARANADYWRSGAYGRERGRIFAWGRARWGDAWTRAYAEQVV